MALYDYALCTVSDVTSTPGFSRTISDDFVIRKINQATDMIENFTKRRFVLTSYTDIEYDATHSDQIVLKQRPVTTLTSFQIRDTNLNESDWETIDSELYFLDSSAGVLDLNFMARGRWNAYRVTYTAGYSIVPADLVEACATLASFLASNPTGSINIRRKQEGQREVEYFDLSREGSADTVLFRQLGIYSTLVAYSNLPVNPDK